MVSNFKKVQNTVDPLYENYENNTDDVWNKAKSQFIMVKLYILHPILHLV